MKLNRLILAGAAAASLFAAQSCLKDQKELFEDSSSERLQAYIDEARSVLASSESGWLMEYYPGEEQALGGYAYYLSFTETEVEAISELDPENSYKSLYKITSDNGAVLSFDSYNTVLHYFATPSSSEYQAKGGDFEFTITSVSPEKIGLRGKRSGNHYDLYPYNSELAPKEYISKVVEMGEGMRAAILEGTIGETEIKGEVDFDARRITFCYDEEKESVSESGDIVTETETVSVEIPYMYTDTGLKAYEPVKVAGYTMDVMYYHSANNILTTGSVTFEGSLPKDYTSFEEFAGAYSLRMYNGRITYNVTLVPNESSTGYLMKGLNSNFDVQLGYSAARGRLTWNSQFIANEHGHSIWMAAWSLDKGGNLIADPAYGMQIARDMSKDGYFVITDNGADPEMPIDSFILWDIDERDSFEDYGDYGQYPYIEALIRK